MEEQEIIKKWQENEKPFGLCSKEMQDWANRQIKGRCFRVYSNPDGEWLDAPYTTPFGAAATYRLRPDYQPEPEEIVCEVRPDKAQWYLFIEYCGMLVELTSSISFIPAKGFRFDRAVFANGQHSHTGVTARIGDKTVHAKQVVYVRTTA